MGCCADRGHGFCIGVDGKRGMQRRSKEPQLDAGVWWSAEATAFLFFKLMLVLKAFPRDRAYRQPEACGHAK
eukprot:12898504-Prorocentrum_lima.AAC.1